MHRALSFLSFAIAAVACATTSGPTEPAAVGTKGNPELRCPPPSATVAAPSYVPLPSATASALLPAMPRPPSRPLRAGEDFTVWGASFSLRNRFERASIAGSSITIAGFVVATNLAKAPRCTVHPRGVADPPGCSSQFPTFWLGDTKDAAIVDCIKVLGWASNFSQVHDAIREYAKQPDARALDELWGSPIPNPLPARGAKLRVRGRYSTTFTKATSGIEADPIMGILDYEEISTLEKAPIAATLPGMKP